MRVIEGERKGVTFIENGADVLSEQDNLLDEGVSVFLQEFIQNLALFRRQVLVIGKERLVVALKSLAQVSLAFRRLAWAQMLDKLGDILRCVSQIGQALSMKTGKFAAYFFKYFEISPCDCCA